MPTDDPFQSSVSIERWPWPLCAVDATAGTPIVRSVTDAFEDRFGPVDDEAPLPAVLSAAGFEAPAWASDSAALRPGTARRLDRVDQADGSTDDVEPHVLQVLAGAGADGRLLSIAPVGDDQRDGSVDVEDVASVLSHDLRNPLDVAKARLRAGRESGDDEHFEHVARAHDRMERLLDDVLTLARANGVDPTDEVALAEVAERAWSTVETEDARLAIDVEGPPVVADEDRLRRLLENLFRNAVEHGSTSPRSPSAREDAVEHGSTSPPSTASQEDVLEHGVEEEDGGVASAADGPGLTVTVGSLDTSDVQRDEGGAPAATTGFYVADDGVGLPTDEDGQVDQSLFEVGYTTNESGTGFGTGIVKEIVDAHDWSITAGESEAGGALFEIRDVRSVNKPEVDADND
jgi:signal transduction histidine kinase